MRRQGLVVAAAIAALGWACGGGKHVDEWGGAGSVAFVGGAAGSLQGGWTGGSGASGGMESGGMGAVGGGAAGAESGGAAGGGGDALAGAGIGAQSGGGGVGAAGMGGGTPEPSCTTCPGGVCIDAYCARNCQTDCSCPTGQACVQRNNPVGYYCMPTCTGASECSSAGLSESCNGNAYTGACSGQQISACCGGNCL